MTSVDVRDAHDYDVSGHGERTRLQLFFKYSKQVQKVAVNMLAVQIWMFTFHPHLHSARKCITHTHTHTHPI